MAWYNLAGWLGKSNNSDNSSHIDVPDLYCANSKCCEQLTGCCVAYDSKKGRVTHTDKCRGNPGEGFEDITLSKAKHLARVGKLDKICMAPKVEKKIFGVKIVFNF